MYDEAPVRLPVQIQFDINASLRKGLLPRPWVTAYYSKQQSSLWHTCLSEPWGQDCSFPKPQAPGICPAPPYDTRGQLLCVWSQELQGQVLLKERLQCESLLLDQEMDPSDQLRSSGSELFSEFIHLWAQEILKENLFIHSFIFIKLRFSFLAYLIYLLIFNALYLFCCIGFL